MGKTTRSAIIAKLDQRIRRLEADRRARHRRILARIELERRIWRLKTDMRASHDWLLLRIEIEKHGGRWVAENGCVFEVHEGAVFQYTSERGVSLLIITALDAEVPYVAELSYDLQGVPPEKRAALVRELNEMARRSVTAATEIIVIVDHDWLSKISLARWGTTDWERHLEPTQATLAARRARGTSFDPNVIYSGDTFEVIP